MFNNVSLKPRKPFCFAYAPASIVAGKGGDNKRHCPVEIRHDGEDVTVIITEPDSAAINSDITDHYGFIARQLARERLSPIPFKRIRWVKHDVRDMNGLESVSAAHFDSSPLFPRFSLVEHLASYTTWGIRFTEDTLYLRTGYHLGRQEVGLPLNRFPSLEKLNDKERRCFTTHKHTTVLYWPRIEEKLVIRDAILFGGGTEKKPAHIISQRCFLYETPSPFLG